MGRGSCAADFREGVDRFEADSDLRCSVLISVLIGTGAAFTADGDLKEMVESTMKLPPRRRATGSKGNTRKPVFTRSMDTPTPAAFD